MKILIIGASRGIGLELCRQYMQLGHEVVATCRTISSELQALKITVVSGIDTVDFSSLQNLASSLGHDTIDMLIHNAGIWRTENIDSMNFETIQEQFAVNAVAPLKSVMAFLPCLKSGAKVGLMSSRMGSIADNTSGGRYGYRMSKCALNMGAKSLSMDLEPSGIAIAILHPGYVRTDMTEGNGDINVDESVRGMIECMDILEMQNTGQFWHYTGKVLPW